jgi:hypothetical protein
MTVENVSNGLRSRLKTLVERVPKTAPKAAVFCHLFTGTETYEGSYGIQILSVEN